MVGLVCRVGQSETNIREAGMERVHVEIAEVGDEGLESSVEVDGIIERKHFFRVEISVIVFKRGIEKVNLPLITVADHRYISRFQLPCSVRLCLHLISIDVEQCQVWLPPHLRTCATYPLHPLKSPPISVQHVH